MELDTMKARRGTSAARTGRALVNAPGDISVRFSRVAARIELRDGIAFFTYNELAE